MKVGCIKEKVHSALQNPLYMRNKHKIASATNNEAH